MRGVKRATAVCGLSKAHIGCTLEHGARLLPNSKLNVSSASGSTLRIYTELRRVRGTN